MTSLASIVLDLEVKAEYDICHMHFYFEHIFLIFTYIGLAAGAKIRVLRGVIEEERFHIVRPLMELPV